MVIDNKYTYLPKELIKVGHSLESLGISEIAWESQDALKAIDFLASKGFAILGGDVYTYDKKGIQSTYDSWYINKKVSESFIQESRKKAFDYIIEYVKDNGCNYLYSIVFELM